MLADEIAVEYHRVKMLFVNIDDNERNLNTWMRHLTRLCLRREVGIRRTMLTALRSQLPRDHEVGEHIANVLAELSDAERGLDRVCKGLPWDDDVPSVVTA